jgi:hypothetical protein
VFLEEFFKWVLLQIEQILQLVNKDLLKMADRCLLLWMEPMVDSKDLPLKTAVDLHLQLNNSPQDQLPIQQHPPLNKMAAREQLLQASLPGKMARRLHHLSQLRAVLIRFHLVSPNKEIRLSLLGPMEPCLTWMAQTKAPKVNPLRVVHHKVARAVTCKGLVARVKAKGRDKVKAKARAKVKSNN